MPYLEFGGPQLWIRDPDGNVIELCGAAESARMAVPRRPSYTPPGTLAACGAALASAVATAKALLACF
jgi:hypothetical protein